MKRLLVFCAAICALGNALCVAETAVDPEFLGNWRATVTNQFGTVEQSSTLSSDGHYILKTEGPSGTTEEKGTFQASKGKWSLNAESGRTDQGIYIFEGHDKVTMGGTLGTAEWHRATTKSAESPPSRPPSNAASAKFSDVEAAARAEAKKWKPGAILVTVATQCNTEGAVNVFANPSTTSFGFYDPDSRESLLVLPLGDGSVKGMPMPAVSQDNLAIPENHIDITQAMAEAKKQGFAGGYVATASGKAGMASLSTFANITGSAPKCAWTITGMDAAGMMKSFVIEAGSGKASSVEEVTGMGELKSQNAMLEQGVPFPRDKAHNYANILAEATALAKRWNPGAKIYQVNIDGGYQAGGLSADVARFNFFASGKAMMTMEGDWSTCEVIVTQEKTYARDIGVNQSKSSYQIMPVPENCISAESAMEKLWALNPNVKSSAVYLQLVYTGTGPNGANQPPDAYDTAAFGAVLQDDGSDEPKDKWIWRMMALRQRGDYRMAGMRMSGGGSNLVFICVDAVTGETYSAPSGPLQSGRPIPGKVDPRP